VFFENRFKDLTLLLLHLVVISHLGLRHKDFLQYRAEKCTAFETRQTTHPAPHLISVLPPWTSFSYYICIFWFF
jgi:hypothetical protein